MKYPLARRLALAGDYADTDWTDPAVVPPGNAIRIKVVSEVLTFALIGRAAPEDGAAVQNLDGVTVDAYLASEVNGTITRDKSIVEVEIVPLDARIKLQASGMVRGEILRLHLTLVGVLTLPAIDVVILAGGRPL